MINCGVVEYKSGFAYKAHFHCPKCLVPNEADILKSISNQLNLQCKTCGKFSNIIIKGKELFCEDLSNG